MGTQVESRRRLVRLAAATAAAAGLAALTYAASASSLTVSSAELFASSDAASVDLPLAYDDFDGCGGDLNGDPDVVANTWLAPSTDWRCRSTYSYVRNRNLDSSADSAIADVGQADHIEVSAYLERTSRTNTNAGSGLTLFHDGTSHHMYVVYQRGNDQVVLGKVDGSGDTTITTAGWLPRSESIELLVVIDQPNITVFADGIQVITHTMTASEVTTFGSNARFGMESDQDRRSRWSWFQVEVTP